MSAVGTALGLSRECAESQPRRVAAGRAEWRPLAALGGITGEWQALVARALEPNVFYDPAFALPAAPVFGNPGAVLVWSKSARLIGFFPARIERRYGLIATLTGWTHPYAPFGVPLVDRDEADAAITAFLDHIEANEKFPRLVLLPFVAAEGAFASVLARVLARHGGAMEPFGTHARALLQPDDRASYLDHALAHKKLKELRRQRRRLEDEGPTALCIVREPDAVSSALADFLTLEASGWKGRAGSAAIEHRAISAFMQGAVTGLARDGNAEIARLMHDGRPVAAAVTLRSGPHAWFWKIAYDETFARASPGVQLTLDLTKHMLADRNLAQADSCATSGHPMIGHLWRERLTLCDVLIAPCAASLARFRVARQLESLRRAMIDAAKRARNLARR
jgi:CelD/BcsL family acetyltransferase involved in cellulose biosynthesis